MKIEIQYNEHSVSMEAASEHDFIANERVIFWGYGASPFGKGCIIWSELGLHELALSHEAEPLLQNWSHCKLLHDPGNAAELFQRIFAQQGQHFMLRPKGTPFQLKVWQALLSIKIGELRSYGDIARLINQPRASRAVGSAIGKNPLAVLIPCHRIIQSTGELGGYHWGAEKKAALIAAEKNAPSSCCF